MPQYQNFSIPTITNDQPSGWEGLQSSLQAGGTRIADFATQQLLEQQKQKQLMGMLIQKAQLDQQNAMALEMAKQQSAQQMEEQGFQRNIQRMQQYPEMFGVSAQGNPMMRQQSPVQTPSQGPVNQPSFNPIMQQQQQSPQPVQPSQSSQGSMSPFSFIIDPSTGKLDRVKNPIYEQQMDLDKENRQNQKEIEKEKRSIDIAKQKQAIEPENADASSAITYTNLMADQVDNIKKIVNKKDFDWGLYGAKKAAVGNVSAFTYNQGIPGLNKLASPQQRQDLIDITNSLNEIKRSVFGEGGKSLTDNEKQVIFKTLDPTGQKKEDWLKLLDQSLGILKSKAILQAKNPSRINQKSSQYSVGQTIPKGGKNYKVVGFDTDGEPLVEESK